MQSNGEGGESKESATKISAMQYRIFRKRKIAKDDVIGAAGTGRERRKCALYESEEKGKGGWQMARKQR